MAKVLPIDNRKRPDKPPVLDKFFRAAIKSGASDLHIKVGQPPKMRINGRLKNTSGEAVTSKTAEELVFEIMSEGQKEFFLENGAIDFAYQISEMDRFRTNVFRQRGMVSMAARYISGDIPPFKSLHLPPIVETISDSHEGLILVTGPTGCGKSTTIASMIDHINRNRSCHIITIEEPIEFLHHDKKAIVSQREIGIDVGDYGDAIRSMMRQDPDVVLIGEMRDTGTLNAAMKAADTGHLVFGTLHSASAAQSIQRILDFYPQEERNLARQTFAMSMKAVVSQYLLPGVREDAKRIPAVEVMLNNGSIRKLIAEERESEIPGMIRKCQGEGMVDFTESLRALVEEEWIDLKTAIQNAPNVEELRMAIKGIRSS